MSRLGKLPIVIPTGVTVTISAGQVKVKGPKGEMVQTVPMAVAIAQKDNQIVITIDDIQSKTKKALWGLTRQLVNNAVLGVTQGFKKQLEINGVGFRAQIEGKDLLLNIGYSHPVKFIVPSGIIVKVEKNLIIIEGFDKQLVGEVAANIRGLKLPEPYKGKGIKYFDEVIRRKAGKLAKTTGPA